MANEDYVGVGSPDGCIVGRSDAPVQIAGSSLSLSSALKGAALTAQLTTITHTAAGTPDYAIQNLTTTSPYGFVTADEGNTVLAVIKNLQTRVAELEARLEGLGLITAN